MPRCFALLLPLLAAAPLVASSGDERPVGGETVPLGEVVTRSGLKYRDLGVGTGAAAKKGDTVVVHYTLTLADGRKLDSTFDRGQPFTFVLGAAQVIKGWDEGVTGMKVGGKRKLIVPPELGYGKGGAGVVPPDAVMIFEIELLRVK
jgi:peptidylprolyl isomerase